MRPRRGKPIQAVLDPLVPGRREHQSREPREGGRRAGAPPKLMQQGWRVFLVKVHNEAGVTAAAARHEPQRRAAVQAVDRQARARSSTDQAERRRRPLARREPVRQPAAQQERSPAWRSSIA